MNIIVKDMLTLLRDKGNLFFIVIFPSLLVFLLGNLLSHMDYSDNAIEPIQMVYTVETTDSFSLIALNAFVKALNGYDSISMVESGDYGEAKAAVEAGEATVAVRFAEPMAVELYEGLSKIQNRAVESIFLGFTRQLASMRALAQYAPTKLAQAAGASAEVLVAQKEFGYNRSMLDYYAVAMLVMILFMGGGIGGASTLYEGRKDGTIRRMTASSISRVSLYVQSVLGAVPQNIIQVICVMLTSVLLFGAHYANTPLDNALLFITFFIAGLAVQAIFMVLGLFLRVNPTLVVMPLMWVLMFISGTFSKEVYIKGVTELSPLWQLQNAAFDLTVFGRSEKCLIAMGVSILLLILFTTIGALLFRRKDVAIS